MAGRPTVMTDEILALLRNAYLMDATDEEACQSANIHPATLYDYQKLHPEFIEEKKLWKKNPVLKAKKTIFENLDDVATARWYAERKARNEFATRTESVSLTPDDVEKELDKLNQLNNKTDYDAVARKAQGQMVADNAPVQDQGQAGESSNVLPQLDAAQTPSGESQPSVQPNS